MYLGTAPLASEPTISGEGISAPAAMALMSMEMPLEGAPAKGLAMARNKIVGAAEIGAVTSEKNREIPR